jgi:integrase
MANEKKSRYSWEDLKEKFDPLVLQAPKTGGDPYSNDTPVDERVIRYIFRYVVGKPWANHITLAAAVLFARNLDVQSVERFVTSLHLRFSAIFETYGLKSMNEWKVDIHLPAYVKGEVISGDSQHTRYFFLQNYASGASRVSNWLNTLPQEEQKIYQQFALPEVNPIDYEVLSKKKEIVERREEHRKTETEAVVPHFAALRAEAHYRSNKVDRLYQAYLQALAQVLPDHSNLPLSFSYEEGDPPTERLYFKLWDRRKFVLDPEHNNFYSRAHILDARNGSDSFSDECNKVFLEFVKAEQLNGEVPAEGLWFTEILRLGLLGPQVLLEGDAEYEAGQAWLKQWGYGDDIPGEQTAPFYTKHRGLLSWSNGLKFRNEPKLGRFINQARKRTGKVFIPIESIYAATTFGLLALDLLTTTGMRIGELMQINLSEECLICMVDTPLPNSKDQSPRIRYALRLLPKGERTNKRYNYGVGKESIRLMQKTGLMLCEHYHLQQEGTLPAVDFNQNHSRRHRFEGEKVPYIFQYNLLHMSDQTIATCMRFLMHGMVFQTSEGEPVVIKPHLLRHAFATYAVQVEGLPIDLVAEWLKQKNLDTTKYYSRIPLKWALEEQHSFLDRFATHINIREAIQRSPEEIRKMAEGALKRVGMFVPVLGGGCTLDCSCPYQFSCIHCPCKVPDPEKRYQVEEVLCYAKERLAYCEKEGLLLEAEKMKSVIRDCELELKEMDMIVAYRKDEAHVAIIQIQPRRQRKQQ